MSRRPSRDLPTEEQGRVLGLLAEGALITGWHGSSVRIADESLNRLCDGCAPAIWPHTVAALIRRCWAVWAQATATGPRNPARLRITSSGRAALARWREVTGLQTNEVRNDKM